MKTFRTIESWASNIGYLVEKNEHGPGYIWYRESHLDHKNSNTINELINDILNDVRKSYEGPE